MGNAAPQAAPMLDDRQFELAVRRLADSLQYGSDASPFLGSGLEYAQSRPYEPGDAVKTIDWRTTARAGRYYVKQYESPKQMATWLTVDDSGSMGVAADPRGGPTKWQWATLLAGALGLAALRATRPVGLMLASGVRHEASLSRARLYGWLHAIRRRPAAGRHSLGDVVRGHVMSLRSRANVIVLSDLHDPALLAALRLAAEPHDVAVLRLQDPAETGTRGGGIFRGVEAETGEAFVATGRSRWHVEDVDETLKMAGIDRITLRTDQSWIAALRNFLASRNGRRA